MLLSPCFYALLGNILPHQVHLGLQLVIISDQSISDVDFENAFHNFAELKMTSENVFILLPIQDLVIFSFTVVEKNQHIALNL